MHWQRRFSRSLGWLWHGRAGRGGLCLCLSCFLCGQTPHEYFEIQYVTPAGMLMRGGDGQPGDPSRTSADMLPHGMDAQPERENPDKIGLDASTGMPERVSLHEVFTPPVGVYKRVQVFDVLDRVSGHWLWRAQERFYQDPLPQADSLDGERVQRRGRAVVQLATGVWRVLPGDSADMVVVRFRWQRSEGGGQEDDLVLGYDLDSQTYAVRARQAGRYIVDYETLSSPLGSRSEVFERLGTLRVGHCRLNAELCLAIRKQVSEDATLKTIMAGAFPVPKLAEFFLGFESQPLDNSPAAGDVLSAIVAARRGLCRHRAIAFAAIASAYGVKVRVVANEAHAFVEVFDGRKWQVVELGGRAESLVLTSSHAPEASAVARTNVDFSESTLTTQIQASLEMALADFQEEPVLQHRGVQRRCHEAHGLARWGLFVPDGPLPAAWVRDGVVRFAGRLLDMSMRPVPFVQAELVLQNSDGRSVSLGETRTDARGRLEMRFRVPPDVSVGQHTLALSVCGYWIAF